MADGTVLLTGAAGVLGTWLRRTAPPGASVVSVVHRTLLDDAPQVQADLRSAEQVRSALERARPSLVVHAAYARDEASVVGATHNVARAASAVGAELIHISSDAVFCGDGEPRDEQDRPDPILDYGSWKARAEALVAEEAPAAAIVRLPLIISLDPEDHIVGAIRAGVRNRERSVWFHDELRQPALASELAEAVWRITALDEGDRSGPWHLPGPESLTRY
ncbi:MAG TPA: sugar nucleotide-binding protein, partial [Acidimicrobiales bacterium]